MYYLIKKATGKVLAKAEAKGRLRRIRRKKKQPENYLVSKYKDPENEVSKKPKGKKGKKKELTTLEKVAKVQAMPKEYDGTIQQWNRECKKREKQNKRNRKILTKLGITNTSATIISNKKSKGRIITTISLPAKYYSR